MTTFELKEKHFDFNYFVIMSKGYKSRQTQDKQTKKKRAKAKEMENHKSNNIDHIDGEMVYCNTEDQLFSQVCFISYVVLLMYSFSQTYHVQVATASLCFPVTEGRDSALSGDWSYDDCELKPYRMIMLIESSQFYSAANNVGGLFSSN